MTPSQISSARRSAAKAALTATVGAITGKRFCAHHQGSVSVELGAFVMRGKVNRWICFECQSKQKGRH